MRRTKARPIRPAAPTRPTDNSLMASPVTSIPTLLPNIVPQLLHLTEEACGLGVGVLVGGVFELT